MDKIPVATMSFSGMNWFIHEDKDAADGLELAEVPAAGWIPAAVPGNIQADLEAARQLLPLWYGAGDPRLAEAAQKDWWYRLDFTAADSFAGKRLRLIFDGVDHACEVWLNGRRLGRHAGMFRRFGFEVADIIQPGETNRLALKIDRIPAELAHILAASDGAMSGGGPDYPREWGPDFFVHGINQTRQLLKDLKSPTNFGWDWGVNIYTLGIWQDARLEATGDARIDWIRVETELHDNNRRARVRLGLEVDSLTALNAVAVFSISGPDQAATAEVEAALIPGENKIAAELWLEDPALWWPNGQGEQPLYSLDVQLVDASSGATLDQRDTRFGIRDIRWEQVEGAPPDFINPFQLVINGRPIRMLGSNILPPDLLFGRMNERGVRLIELAAQAGMNTIRVWGGGVFPTEAMFDRADELGIMLSQEFPLSSCVPEDDPVFLDKLERTARQLVKRSRNHPCIIEWTGGNEMWWSQGDDYPALHLFERVIAETDNRLFRATCPIQGSRHSPWHYDPETHYSHFNDEDMRDTGMTRGQYKMMRYGEFGCHTLAHLEVWQRELPPADQTPPYDEDNPVLIRKNIAQAVFTKQHWLLEPIMNSFFGPLDSLPTMLEAGQYLGAHGLRYAVDALRRRGRRLGGLMTWVLNEPWPNGGGPYHVDYDGRPLMIYDFLKQALAPISLSLRSGSNLYDPDTGLDADLWLVSDAPEPAPDLRWRWLVRDGSGRALAQAEGGASIEPIEAIRLGAIKTDPVDGDARNSPLLVELTLSDGYGVLQERLHIFGSSASQAPLAALLPGGASDARSVAQTSLEAEVLSRRLDGEGESLEIALTNSGAMTAFFCEPHPLLAYRTDLSIENNHICIPPGGSCAIIIRAPLDSQTELTLPQTGWRLSCWNAEDIVIPPSDDVIFSIGRRDAMTREFMREADLSRTGNTREIVIRGNRPDPAELPLLMTDDLIVGFEFDVAGLVEGPARLRLHTCDQDNEQAPQVNLAVNCRQFDGTLTKGYGIQREDPDHLASPQTLAFDLPPGTLTPGRNTIELRLNNPSWFTWDAIDLLRQGTSN
ncbi:MAG: hypothetical protein OXG85_13200 [Chloroflexi bacterium]|nr:hypothetical protein [Chloroflexota bacterium]